MRTTPLLILLTAAAPLAAQVADSSPFRRLDLPTPNEYRSAGGARGRRYWQSRADYVREARLDTVREELRGRGLIR